MEAQLGKEGEREGVRGVDKNSSYKKDIRRAHPTWERCPGRRGYLGTANRLVAAVPGGKGGKEGGGRDNGKCLLLDVINLKLLQSM